MRQKKKSGLADLWRYKATAPAQIIGDGESPALKHDIRDFTPAIIGSDVHYSRSGEEIGFVDRGRRVEVYDWQNRDTTFAALQLSAQKWGSFRVFGNDEYMAMCVRLAAEHGFRISNPELQDRIAAERVKIREERKQAIKSAQVQHLERYHDAVNADRYRVTSRRMMPDGDDKVFVLDKTSDGVTKGFTPAELVQRTPEMVRLESRGENVYLTPLSDTKHHILIDDVSRDTLAALVTDGYKPAVVIESSPGNYQAVITIAKLGMQHDKNVGNRLSKILNEKYGNRELSGAIHPHRAPGFTNRKPKHQREDGSYPEVILKKAERRECGKSAAMAVELNQAYKEQAAAKKARQPAPRDPTSISKSRFKSETVANGMLSYYLHRADIIARQSGKTDKLDLSRADSMIALCMRMTGHSPLAIEETIAACAPTAHPDKKAHVWKDYAERATRYAFGPKGDQQMSKLQSYRGQWLKQEAEAQTRRDKGLMPEPVPSPAAEPLPVAPTPKGAGHEPLQAADPTIEHADIDKDGEAPTI